MFVEGKQDEGGLGGWLDARARAHPWLFTCLLVVMMASITLGLLLKTGGAIILYQEF